MNNSDKRESFFCYNILLKTVSNFNEFLIEKYHTKPSENFGIYLDYLAYSSCCLLFTLVMTKKEKKEAELLVENVLEGITDFWDTLKMEDMLSIAEKTEPSFSKLINDKTNSEFLDGVKKDVSKVIAVPNQITTMPGMRLDYVINKTLEYWSCVVKRMATVPTNYPDDPMSWIEEEVEPKFLRNIYPIYERATYNKGKGLFAALSFLIREEYDNEMDY